MPEQHGWCGAVSDAKSLSLHVACGGAVPCYFTNDPIGKVYQLLVDGIGGWQ